MVGSIVGRPMKVHELPMGTRFKAGNKIFVLLNVSGLSSALVREVLPREDKLPGTVPGRAYRIASVAEVDKVFGQEDAAEDLHRIMTSGSSRRSRVESAEIRDVKLAEQDRNKRKEKRKRSLTEMED
jgi:hypothetical protein